MKKGLWIAPVLLGLSLWLIYSPEKQSGPQSLNSSKDSSQHSAEQKGTKAVQLDLSVAKKTGAKKESVSAREAAPLDPRFELYTELNRKALMTDQEAENMRSLVGDEDLISQLGPLLRSDYLTNEPLQFAALDLVFDALEIGSQAAQTQLKNIVTDSFIEDSSNDFSQRQALAELKAEVLYRWAAAAPELDSEMRSWLPGSVSEKIWENVKRVHKNNLLESDQST